MTLALRRFGWFFSALVNGYLRWRAPWAYKYQDDDAFNRAVALPDFWHRLEPYCMRMEKDDLRRWLVDKRDGALYLVTADKLTEPKR